MKASADTLGINGTFIDPLWRIEVRLTPIEQDLLRSWWVRRLGFINHAGAASATTTQSYTRLEHSLGLLALVSHFTPNDHHARVAALLHDIGHLPFSHTFEQVAGLDHHVLGTQRIQDLSAVLERQGLDPQTIIDTIDGTRRSGLRGGTTGLRLDHLDSFIRSGRAHGRTTEPPSTTLRKLRLVDGVVDTDPSTADYLKRLTVAEAQAQATEPNLVAVAVIRELASRILDTPAQHQRSDIAAMTDDEFWALLLAHPMTSADAAHFRRAPTAWQIDPADAPPTGTEAIHVRLRRLYLDLPLTNGHPTPPIDPTTEGLPLVPRTFRIVRQSSPQRPSAWHPGTR